MRKALAIVHVALEDLGSLKPSLEQEGFAIETREAALWDLRESELLAPDLVVVLGGPIGVYEQEAYPFLAAEIEGLRARLEARRPTLGVCLGAQLMAAALGARVYPGAAGKEIGWGRLLVAEAAAELPSFKAFLKSDPHVLHWHGDTFDLPPGARRLASTEKYRNQAFALGDFALGLQFHLEVTVEALERWYVGHAVELAKARVDVRTLRAASRLHAAALEADAAPFWRRWIDEACGGAGGNGSPLC
jgi:GMP synthase (glutamine-hydrolysing)